MAALGAALAAGACLKTTEPSCAGGTVSHAYVLGDTATDTLGSHACRHFYAFALSGQAALRVKLSSPGLQTFLQLYDHRSAIVMNSAYTQSVDTATTVRLILGMGNYGLMVNAVNAGQAGAFRMVTETDTAAVHGCGAVWVTPGITTTQTITAADCTLGPAGTSYRTHVFTMVLLVGDQLSLVESTTAFPPGIVLTGQGTTVASTLDSTGTVASITSVVGIQGAYNIWAGSTSAGQNGKYTLQVK